MPADVRLDLVQLLDRLDELKGTPAAESVLRLLGETYNSAVAELGRAQASGPELDRCRLLNDAVARASRVLYGRTPMRSDSAFRQGVDAFFRGLSLSVGPVQASAGLVLGGFLAGLAAISAQSKLLYIVAPAPLVASLDAMSSSLTSSWFGNHEISRLLEHNVFMLLLVVASGVIAGIGPAVAMFAGGLQVGCVAVIAIHMGHTQKFLGWFLVQGLPHLLALVCAGAAGLALGWALVAPGLLSRREALGTAGRQMTSLCTVALGCALFQIVTGGMVLR